MKGHIQSNIKKRLIHRLKIIQGQAKGLEKAVKNEKYCVDVLIQSAAIQQSLKSFDALMLENHIKTHVRDQLKGKNIKQATKELLKIYKLNRR